MANGLTGESFCKSDGRNPIVMKITRIDRNGERREALLKEYFLAASLIAVCKRIGEEVAKAPPHRAPLRVPVPIEVARDDR